MEEAVKCFEIIKPEPFDEQEVAEDPLAPSLADQIFVEQYFGRGKQLNIKVEKSGVLKTEDSSSGVTNEGVDNTIFEAGFKLNDNESSDSGVQFSALNKACVDECKDDGSCNRPCTYTCEHCDYRTCSELRFDKHFKSCKRYSCSQLNCEYKTNYSGDLKRHVNSIHRKIKSQSCTECDYKSATSSELERHVSLVHPRINSFSCADWILKTEDELSRVTNGAVDDVITETGLVLNDNELNNSVVQSSALNEACVDECKDDGSCTRPCTYSCEHCDYRTCSELRFDKHFKICKRYSCSHLNCEYKTSYLSDLKRHVNSVHQKIKFHSCSECDYKSTTSSVLKRHVSLVHQRIKSHACEDCEYRSGFLNDLKRHILVVHQRSKAHACSDCDYKSGSASDLKKHFMAVHQKVKPHSCTECEFKSSCSRDLKRHVLIIHKGIKSYACAECEYKSGLPSDLKKHILAVHRKFKPHSCPECDFKSSSLKNLRRHIMAVHKKGE